MLKNLWSFLIRNSLGFPFFMVIQKIVKHVTVFVISLDFFGLFPTSFWMKLACGCVEIYLVLPEDVHG
jgi:hypothetical protein